MRPRGKKDHHLYYQNQEPELSSWTHVTDDFVREHPEQNHRQKHQKHQDHLTTTKKKRHQVLAHHAD